MPDEILINAIHMRDQFEDLRKRMRDSTARLKRQKLNFNWDNPELDELRPVAEEIWQLAYNEPMTAPRAARPERILRLENLSGGLPNGTQRPLHPRLQKRRTTPDRRLKQMKKFRLSLALLLVGATLLSGCSMLTAHGRQEAAYERYVREIEPGPGQTTEAVHLQKDEDAGDATIGTSRNNRRLRAGVGQRRRRRAMA